MGKDDTTLGDRASTVVGNGIGSMVGALFFGIPVLALLRFRFELNEDALVGLLVGGFVAGVLEAWPGDG